MRTLVLGGTGFIGRRIVEKLVARGDEVLVLHRGTTEPADWVSVRHLYADRDNLGGAVDAIKNFDPECVVDSNAMTGTDVEHALRVVPDVPTVVLSSQDVYEAVTALRAGTVTSAVPLREDAELRRERYPYRGKGYVGVPEDYEKLDVEALWLPRGAVVLRLPMVYGPFDDQQREAPILRRIISNRSSIPIGPGTLLWSRAHVEDISDAVLAALDTRRADGMALNLGERDAYPIVAWYQQIIDSSGSDARLVQVPDAHVPPDLALTTSRPQHLLVSVELSTQLLGLKHPDPRDRVVESVTWHLANTPLRPFSEEEGRLEDEALTQVI